MKDRGKGQKQLLKKLTVLQRTNAELQSLLAERDRAVKEAHEIENGLRLQVENLKSILDGAGDDIALTDADGTIIYENDRVEDLFGYTREESLGKNIFDFPIFGDGRFNETRRIFDELLKGHNRQLHEIEFIRKDGSTVFVEVNQKPCIKSGKVEGTVSVVRDITERKRYEEKLRGLYEQERRLREQIEAEEHLTRALDLGANDYITKPFRRKELLARLRAQLRGGNPAEGEMSIISGQLRLVPKTCQLIFGRRVIGLTIIECLILQKLMRKTGHIVTHSDLAEAIWGEDSPGAIVSLRTYIHRLRQKIESNPNNPKLILTKAGIGYSLVKQPQNSTTTVSNKLPNSLIFPSAI